MANTVAEAAERVADARQDLTVEERHLAAVEAEAAAILTQVKSADPDDLRAFGRLADAQKSVQARLEAMETRVEDKRRALAKAQASLAKAQTEADKARAVDLHRAALESDQEISRWLREDLLASVAARLGKHRALVQEASLLHRKLGGEALRTRWSAVLPDSDLWQSVVDTLAEESREARIQASTREQLRRQGQYQEQVARRLAEAPPLRYGGPAPVEGVEVGLVSDQLDAP